jgi:hypothetical protein
MNKEILVKSSEGNVVYKGKDLGMSNGNNKIVFYFLTVTVGILVVMAVSWANTVQAKINNYDQLVIERGERLTYLETSFSTVATRLTNFDNKLDKIIDQIHFLTTELAIEKNNRKNSGKILNNE